MLMRPWLLARLTVALGISPPVQHAPCRQARARQLGMITYRIVPFSPRAGLLEWLQVRRR